MEILKTTKEKCIKIPVVVITAESMLERAVILAMVDYSLTQWKESPIDFLETVKIKMDDLTGKENLFPNKIEVYKLLDKIENIKYGG
jgi:hypothetical protein